MGSLYQRWIRPALFRLEAEKAHHLAVAAMGWLGGFAPLRRAMEGWALGGPGERLGPTRVFGLQFPTPVGLAAGFDKNARAWPAAAALGFGHVEIGTVTHLPQEGNPRPRLFRYPAEEAVINRLGFNNEGASAVAARLARQADRGRRRVPLGINLGKSRAVEVERATEDYHASFVKLADYADYIVLNVSSPNTPGLRRLQEKAKLRELLLAITSENRARGGRPGGRRVPLLLKISPDLEYAQIDEVLGVIAEFALDGVIATNTTLERPGIFAQGTEAGGLSGAPLRRRSTEIIRYIAHVSSGRLPIVGCGGVTDAESAAEKFDAGAALVQIYTALIYRGPFLARELALGLARRRRPGGAG